MVEKLVWMLAGHFMGDFAFQSEWMAKEKAKSWEVNAYHALVYTASVFVTVWFGGIKLVPAALVLLAVSHFVIDPLKARYNIIKSIWVDQLLHILVILYIAYFLSA